MFFSEEYILHSSGLVKLALPAQAGGAVASVRSCMRRQGHWIVANDRLDVLDPLIDFCPNVVCEFWFAQKRASQR